MVIKVRFVERPLRERPLTPQRKAVHQPSSLRELSITDTGIEIMTAIVGTGMRPSQRKVVGASLREALHGETPAEDKARGDVFTAVYGEVLGPLITCLEREGDYEVIRLVSAPNETAADVLLLNRLTGHLILQECKGNYAYARAGVRSGSTLDVCRQMRRRRNEGRKQLVWPGAETDMSRRVRITGTHRLAESPIACGEESVVVTTVPDGRLQWLDSPDAATAAAACPKSCTRGCLFAPDAAVITILSSERAKEIVAVGEDTRRFLDWYKTCERAIWGSAHGSFTGAYSSLLESYHRLDVPPGSAPQAFAVFSALAYAAVSRGLYVDFERVQRTCQELQQGHLVEHLRALSRLQVNVHPPGVTESSAEAIGRMLYPEGKEPPSDDHVLGNFTFVAHGPERAPARSGTPVETRIQRSASGGLEIVMVPSQPPGADGVNNMRWALAQILSTGRFPVEYAYELFDDELAEWTGVNENETRSFQLGKSLIGPWPFLFPDRRVLHEMRRCCPMCDEWADMIEHGWPWRHCSELLLHHRRMHHVWRHHHPGVWPFGPYDGGAMAFITTDARAVLRLPLVG
ncbi:MAG: hypothetical protein JXA69_07045 [Phycisphaerae bacterium]|nr:hypothetical protein [Phycisphaerae bacterium]